MSICNSLIIGEIEYFFICLQNTNLDGFKLVCYNITSHDFFKLTGKLRENTKAVKSSWKHISKRGLQWPSRDKEKVIEKKSISFIAAEIIATMKIAIISIICIIFYSL